MKFLICAATVKDREPYAPPAGGFIRADMKKLFLLLLLAVTISGCGISNNNSSVAPVATVAPLSNATLILDFGGGKVTTYSSVLAKTAFEALEKVAVENGITMDVKKYDFGMMVNSIAGSENSKDLSWIYYVNGKSPDVGADKYELKDGDKIEWKFIKPSF